MKFKIFENQPVSVLFSQKADGFIRVKPSGDTFIDEQTEARRVHYLQKNNIDMLSVVFSELAHNNHVAIVTDQETGTAVPECDGLVTDMPNLYVAVTVADCLPIFLFDPEKQIIGLVHAGWQGLSLGIIHNALERMTQEFSSDPKDILVAIGPHIHQENYEVKPDMYENFVDYPDAFIVKEGRTFLNLMYIAVEQLKKEGVTAEHIELHPDDTYAHPDRYFSFRRDKPQFAEPHLVLFKMN